jgi:hypothetical protein
MSSRSLSATPPVAFYIRVHCRPHSGNALQRKQDQKKPAHMSPEETEFDIMTMSDWLHPTFQFTYLPSDKKLLHKNTARKLYANKGIF